MVETLSGADPRDQEPKKPWRRTIKDLVEKRPELGELLPDSKVVGDPAVLEHLPEIMEKYSQQLELLEIKSILEPEYISLLIIPNHEHDGKTVSLIFGKIPDEDLVVMTPTLRCTQDAVDDEVMFLPRGRDYLIVTTWDSRAEMENVIWKNANNDPRTIFEYGSDDFTARDYLAYAVLGGFKNEVFRTYIQEK